MSTLTLMGAGSGAGTAIAPIDPATLSPVAQWKASDLGLTDGAAVSSWAGSGGVGPTMSQATGTNQPTYKTNILNGQPVVRFDGTDDWLLAASAVDVAQVIIVAKYSGATFSNFVGLFTGSTNNAPDLILTGSSGATNWTSGDYTTYFKDGVSMAINAAGSGPMNAFATMSAQKASANSLTLQFGRDRATAVARWWTGDVAEAVVFSSALSTAQRQGVEVWYRSLYGTP